MLFLWALEPMRDRQFSELSYCKVQEVQDHSLFWPSSLAIISVDAYTNMLLAINCVTASDLPLQCLEWVTKYFTLMVRCQRRKIAREIWHGLFQMSLISHCLYILTIFAKPFKWPECVSSSADCILSESLVCTWMSIIRSCGLDRSDGNVDLLWLEVKPFT